MLISFKRITSSGNYFPEIDGLRFLAISSVFVFHLANFISTKDTHTYHSSYNLSILKEVCSRGYFGVQLFFVISGYVLGLPFAQHYLANGKPVNLKNYFLRRITRLEPPYIIVMTVLLFACLFIVKKPETSLAIKSFLYSIIYSHNFAFGNGILPYINIVAWSLEIEVQFYILAPLLALIFKINNQAVRRTVLIASIAVLTITGERIGFSFTWLINYLEYFLLGLYLSDLKVSSSLQPPVASQEKNSLFSKVVSAFCLIGIWCFDKEKITSPILKTTWELTQLLFIGYLYYEVLIKQSVDILKWRWIAFTGGMCYSIYLIHYSVISLVGNPIIGISFSHNQLINQAIYAITLLFAVMVTSSIFFLLIERPCMDKNWPAKLWRLFTR